MPDEKPLRRATEDEVMYSLSFALRFDGRKPVRYAEDAMASLMARHLMSHLERSGYVIMKGPPAGPNSNPGLWYPEKPK